MTQFPNMAIPRKRSESVSPQKEAFTIIRESGEVQLRGYGPDSQWEDDVLPNAATLGIHAGEQFRRII